MMKSQSFLFTLLICLVLNPAANASNKGQYEFYVHNPQEVSRQSAPGHIPLSALGGGSDSQVDRWLVKVDGQDVPSQLVDTGFDGKNDALLFLHDFQPQQTLSVTVTPLKSASQEFSVNPKTQADMGVRVGGKLGEDGIYKGGVHRQVSQMTLPEGHTIGNKLFRYEGFGWESNKVAYRYYFDERATTDIFGKTTEELILHKVGHDDGDYHILNDWGMDVLKVGGSLGIGTLAAWHDESIVKPNASKSMAMALSNGAVSSEVVVSHKGWQLGDKDVDLKTTFSIMADSRLTHVKGASSLPLDSWVTGIVKHGVERLEFLSCDSEWNYIATYGSQSLAKDDLGMVVFFRHRDMSGQLNDPLSETVLLKAGDSTVEYYFAALWVQETNGIRSLAEFKNYLKSTVQQLNNPVEILQKL